MKKLLVLSSILLVSLLLSACNPAQPTQVTTPIGITVVVNATPIPSDTPTVEGAYPIDTTPGTFVGNIYPAGQEPTAVSPTEVVNTAEPLQVPDSEDETAIILGIVLSLSTGQPLKSVDLYLADKTPLGDTGEYVYSLQEKSSPHTLTDSSGQFIIAGVKPGPYVVMMTTPFGNYIALNEDNQEIHLDLEAGDVLDLGTIYINWP